MTQCRLKIIKSKLGLGKLKTKDQANTIISSMDQSTLPQEQKLLRSNPGQLMKTNPAKALERCKLISKKLHKAQQQVWRHLKEGTPQEQTKALRESLMEVQKLHDDALAEVSAAVACLVMWLFHRINNSRSC